MKRAALLLMLLPAGCAGVQSSAGRDGFHADRIASLFDLFLWVTVGVYAFVLVYLALALWKGRARAGVEATAGEERGWNLALVVFATVTALILTALSAATWLTDRSLAKAPPDAPLEIKVTGYQWWWKVEYLDPVPANIVTTANELHLPAGRSAHVTLASGDVIHSLWIPNLAGKKDLIPGHETDLELRPLHPGVYRAQCAEFCGLQHANMALDVTVESPGAFAAWRAAQLAPPPIPTGGPALVGKTILESIQCASCHTVSGTNASGKVAPDLSHVGSRKTIAAGALPADRQGFALWIENPQAHKPGNNMPKVPLTPEQIDALAAYLETLK
jgi:cytochrome c oxidase subunit 2